MHIGQSRSRVAGCVAVMLVGVVGIAAAASSAGATAAPAPVSRPTPANHGLSYLGLHPHGSGRCPGGFEISGHDGSCTHGPDSTDEFALSKSPGGTSTGGKKTGPSPSPSPSASPSPTAGTSALC